MAPGRKKVFNQGDHHYEIHIDLKLMEWSFQKESYNIGKSLRVPEDGERWGPMMVYNPWDKGHVNQFELAKADFEARCLTC
jgi:hypothetical protein